MYKQTRASGIEPDARVFHFPMLSYGLRPV